jgi:hypothetical protein
MTANATRPAPQHLRIDSRRSHDRLCERVLGFQRRRAVKRSVLGTRTVAALIRGVQPLLNKGISMKLKHEVIKNFKGVREVEFPSNAAPRALRSVTALLGDNGSEKTSVLQAIALTLSMATRRTRDMASFIWHGFLPERVPSLGPKVQARSIGSEESECSPQGREKGRH